MTDWTPAHLLVDGLPTAVPGQVATFARWNGWAVPRFQRPAVEQVVAALTEQTRQWEELTGKPDPDRTEFRWEGDVLLEDLFSYHEEDDYEPTRYEPDADGWYALGAYGWCWSEAEPTE